MDAVFAFEDELERQGKRPATVFAYGRDLAAFARWLRHNAGDAAAPEAATEPQLLAYWDHLLRSAAAPATAARRLAALRAFLRWARATGLRRGPATVPGFRRPRPAPRRLGAAEAAAFVRAVERAGDARAGAVVLLLARARLRVGELAALRLADLALGPRAGSVTVRAARGADCRVGLDAPTRRALAAYLAVRPASTSPALVLSQAGDGLSANGVHGLVAAYARRAGLAGVTPSALRRAAG